VPSNKIIEKNITSVESEKQTERKGFKKVIKKKSSDESE
jgi:hypothetical protein